MLAVLKRLRIHSRLMDLQTEPTMVFLLEQFTCRRIAVDIVFAKLERLSSMSDTLNFIPTFPIEQ